MSWSGLFRGHEVKHYLRVAGAAAWGFSLLLSSARWVLQAMPVSGVNTLDGKRDQPDWQRAPVFGDLIENVPREKARARVKPEVRVLYDSTAI